MQVKFVFVDVPEDPGVPYMAMVLHHEHSDCELGDMQYLVLADFALFPIPYSVINMNGTDDLISHEKEFIEHGLREAFLNYVCFRN